MEGLGALSDPTAPRSPIPEIVKSIFWVPISFVSVSR